MASSDEVRGLLPHAEPFLLVDCVVDRGQDWLATEWRVPQDLDVLRGHFPGNPVLPGVLICEHVFQSGALLVYSKGDALEEPGTPVLTRIEDARFRRLVRPGDVLRTEVRLQERLANAYYFRAKVSCDGATVARLRFTLALARST